jgi:hypothetical protein
VYLDRREVPPVKVHRVEPAAAAHARLRQAALDFPPRLRLGDPRLHPPGEVDEAVLLPGPDAAAAVGDDEREHGEREHGDGEQEHGGHVHPEERPAGGAAPARAHEADDGEDQHHAAEREDRELQRAVAVGGGARAEVHARADQRQGQEERHYVHRAQEAVAQPRHCRISELGSWSVLRVFWGLRRSRTGGRQGGSGAQDVAGLKLWEVFE